MARSLSSSFGSEGEEGPCDSLGVEETDLEAFLDSALNNDPVLKGILNEGLTQIIKAAIRLLNLQRRREKGQSQGPSRESKGNRQVSKSKVANATNCGDPGGPRGNNLSEEDQGSNQSGADYNSPIEIGNNGFSELLEKSPRNPSSDHIAATGTKRQPAQEKRNEGMGKEPTLPGLEGGLNFKKRPTLPPKQKQCQRKKGPCCYFCHKTLPIPSLLEMHLTTHTQEKPFPCTLCGKEFALKGYLDVHLRSHRKEKPFICNFCGKGFPVNCNLEEHIRRHLKEKWFKCPFKGCTSSFASGTELKTHSRVHSDSGEKPFKCNLCGKGVVTKQCLEDHIRRHLKEKFYKCPHKGCSSSFVTGSELKKHARIHSEEKPFACSHPGCGKTFIQSSNLRIHSRVHSGEAFACPVPGCGKTFSYKGSLARHRKNHERSSAL